MPISIEARNTKKEWIELWFKMANGVKSEYDKIYATDVFEFWTLYDLWLERIKAANAKARAQQRDK